jgi:hypothetical protein
VTLLAPIGIDSRNGASASGEGRSDPVLRWNRTFLEGVRESTLAPPAVARGLAILNTCIYDAWAAYDPVASGTRLGTSLRRPEPERTDANRISALNVAAYQAAVDILPGQRGRFDRLLRDLNSAAAAPAGSDSPPAIGARACQAVLDFRHGDGSNQLGDIPGSSGAPYSDYTNYQPVNTPDEVRDPNRWQPLRVQNAAGQPVVQRFLLPQWSRLVPFGVERPSLFRAPGSPARYGTSQYVKQADDIVAISAALSDESKSIAEYWADGPGTETPPGHWILIGTYCAERDGMSLEQNVKMFFLLGNALFDAGIVAWDRKVAFDYVRPITAIRYIYTGHRIEAWGGPGKGTQIIDGGQWQPYLPTPPFAEYTSGHSTFSAAAAQMLRLVTNSDNFGGQALIPARSSTVDPGSPHRDVALHWATFSDAAAQAGLSRRIGGIHFEKSDTDGQTSGRAAALAVWARAQRYFHGLS